MVVSKNRNTNKKQSEAITSLIVYSLDLSLKSSRFTSGLPISNKIFFLKKEEEKKKNELSLSEKRQVPQLHSMTRFHLI